MMETKSRAEGESSAGGALTVQAVGTLLQSPASVTGCACNPNTGEGTGVSLGLTVGQPRLTGESQANERPCLQIQGGGLGRWLSD